jgi:hypothetical protein
VPKLTSPPELGPAEPDPAAGEHGPVEADGEPSRKVVLNFFAAAINLYAGYRVIAVYLFAGAHIYLTSGNSGE